MEHSPSDFTTTGRMGKECLSYHSRLVGLIAIKKGEDYAKTISWIRARTSFALLRSALICTVSEELDSLYGNHGTFVILIYKLRTLRLLFIDDFFKGTFSIFYYAF